MKWLMDMTTKKLKILSLVFNLLVIIFVAVIPMVLVCTKYQVFGPGSATKLNGWVLVFIIIIAVPTLKLLGRLVNRMPDIIISGKHKGEINILKYVIRTVKRLILPLLLYVVIVLFKDDVRLAFDTFIWVLTSIIGGLIIEEFFLSPIEYLISLDTQNAEQDAKDMRRAVNSKQEEANS